MPSGKGSVLGDRLPDVADSARPTQSNVRKSSNEPGWGKISNVHMLVGTGRRERTVAEYGPLFAGAGFRLTRTIAIESATTIIEGVRV